MLKYLLVGAICLFPAIANNPFEAVIAEDIPFVVVRDIVVREDIAVSRGGERAGETFVLTAYDLSYESCEKYEDDPEYGITATGKRVREGMIAVDPKVIPLGSKVFIEGLGEYIAEDVGGDIKGNRIDVFIPSRKAALEFGRQKRKVYKNL